MRHSDLSPTTFLIPRLNEPAAYWHGDAEPHRAEPRPREECCLGMKRKVRLRLDVYQRDLAGEKLAPEVEAIALGRIDLAHRSAAKLVISGPILQCRFGALL